MNTWVILLAAGQSTRLARQGVTTLKQFLSFAGEPLFLHSARMFSRIPQVQGIVFVFPSPELGKESSSDFAPAALEEYTAWMQKLTGRKPLGLQWRVVFGGNRRQDSVFCGLGALPSGCQAVLVHDAARPFMTPALPLRILHGLAAGHVAVIPGIPLVDTVKVVDANALVTHTPDRATLRAVQTPQGFLREALYSAHVRAKQQAWEVTDDAALMELCTVPVCVVEGEETNRKITTFEDLKSMRTAADSVNNVASCGAAVAAPGMSGDKQNGFSSVTGVFNFSSAAPRRTIPCTGLGYDVHRYGGTRPFILGGVPIATDIRVSAHSDGDTLLHALIDAMLGCIGAGDIGDMFPDTNAAYDNISSGLLLAEVRERTEQAGLIITHVDITIIAQTPRIAPHRAAIAKNIAKLLHLPLDYVNVKATTEEHLGFTGEKKGIKVMALVTGSRPAVGEGNTENEGKYAS